MNNWNQPPGQPPGAPPQGPPPGPPPGAPPPGAPPHGGYAPDPLQPAVQRPSPNAPYVPPAGIPHPRPGNGTAIAGMVLGICGIVFWWIPIAGLVVAGLGIMLGASGMSKANELGGAGKGFGIAGLVCGLVGLVLSLLMTGAFFMALA